MTEHENQELNETEERLVSGGWECRGCLVSYYKCQECIGNGKEAIFKIRTPWHGSEEQIPYVCPYCGKELLPEDTQHE